MSVVVILVGLALLLGLLSLLPNTAQWPLLAVAVLLLGIAMLVPALTRH